METKNNFWNIEFREYAKNKRGQHFMTIIVHLKGRNVITGYMYREYDKESGKMIYTAKDSNGNPVFEDIKDKYKIMNGFKESGKALAEIEPIKPQIDTSRDTENPSSERATNRAEELRELREGKTIENVEEKDEEKDQVQNMENEQETDRDQELNDIREEKENDRDQDFDRDI
jgi:hypothetical protein